MAEARHQTLQTLPDRVRGRWHAAVWIATNDAIVFGGALRARLYRHRLGIGLALMFLGLPIGAFPEILGWPLQAVVSPQPQPYGHRVVPVAACLLMIAAWIEAQRPHLLAHRRYPVIASAGIGRGALAPAWAFAGAVVLAPVLLLVVPLITLIPADGPRPDRMLVVALAVFAALVFAWTTAVAAIAAVYGLFCVLGAASAGLLMRPIAAAIIVAAILLGLAVAIAARGTRRFSAMPPLAPRVALWSPVLRHAPVVASELRKLGTAMRAYTLFKLGSGLFVAAAAIELVTRVEDPVQQWALVVCAMALLGVLMLAVADALADNDGPVRWLVGTSAVRLEPQRTVVVVPLLFVPVLALLVGGPTALVHGARSAAVALFGVMVVVTSLVPAPPSDSLRLLGRSSMMAAWGLVAFYGIPSS